MKKGEVMEAFSRYAKYYFVVIFIILIIVLAYYYLLFNFRTGDIVYKKNSNTLGEINGISFVKFGYLVYWSDGTYTPEFVFNLERAEQIKESNFSQDGNQNKTLPYLPPADLKNITFSEILYNELSREKVDDLEGIYEQIPDVKKSEFCLPSLKCGDWSECQVNYNFESLLNYDKIEGLEYKFCTDLNKCLPDIVGSRGCLSKINITVSKAFWCGTEYTEIRDKNGKVLARLDTKNRAGYMDIRINLGSDYCSYCYDHKMDYDETGLDCGGSCRDCIKNGQ